MELDEPKPKAKPKAAPAKATPGGSKRKNDESIVVIEDPLPKQKKKRANSAAPTPAKADDKQENARKNLRAVKRKPAV